MCAPWVKIRGRNVRGLGGHSISVGHFNTHALSNVQVTVFRYWQTSQWKWAGLLSCWNMESRYVS